jgi:hypothetical protein
VRLSLIIGLFLVGSAFAQQPAGSSMPLQDAPCIWFSKALKGWHIDNHDVKLNKETSARNSIIERGVVKMDDGTDAYDFLDRKCGRPE